MLKKLAENLNNIRANSVRTNINRRIWAQVSFDRKEPTIKIHDNTSFIELSPAEVTELKNYLISLDDDK